ncbi:MAG: hypothetical protein Q9175_007967 [Cornicularia normoerica]
MHSIRHILSISLLLTLSSSFVYAHQTHQTPQDQEEESGFAGLQKLLDQVDAPSLHAALHDLSPKKFKHGMFRDDRTAVEAIHKDEPSLATSVVNIAKRNVMDDIKKDLDRRAQDISNGTTPTTTPAAIVPGPTTTNVATPVPQGGQTSLSTTSSSSTDVSPTLAGPGSSTPSTTASTSTSSNGAIVTGAGSSSTTSTSNSAGESPSTTGASSASPTRGEVITSTNSVGLTIVSTVGGGVHTISPSPGSSTTSSSTTQSSITSTVVHTSTLPDGSQSVVTAVTVVGAGGVAADTPTGTASVAVTGSSSGSPHLQTGEAPMTRGWCKEMVLVFGGAVGVAMLM